MNEPSKGEEPSPWVSCVSSGCDFGCGRGCDGDDDGCTFSRPSPTSSVVLKGSSGDDNDGNNGEEAGADRGFKDA